MEEESKEKITSDWEHVEIRQVNHTTSSDSNQDQQDGNNKVNFGGQDIGDDGVKGYRMASDYDGEVLQATPQVKYNFSG